MFRVSTSSSRVMRAMGLPGAEDQPVSCGLLLCLHRGDGHSKAIAAPRNGLDDLRSGAVAGERLAEQEDVLGQVALFDERFRPERTQQLIFSDHSSGMIHQVKKQVEGLPVTRQGIVPSAQLPSGAINFILFNLSKPLAIRDMGRLILN